MNMTSVQLSIPFPNTLKLSEKHKCTLIASQAKKLAIEEWEINSLIQLCKGKGWVGKGLGLLYKYAGHVDELQHLLTLFVHYYLEIINYSYLNLMDTLGKFSLLVLRIFYCLSSWRKIQFSPRPVYIVENGRRHTLSKFISLKIMLVFPVVRRVSSEIWPDLNSSLLKEIIINIFGEDIFRSHQYDSPGSVPVAEDWFSMSYSNSKYYIRNSLIKITEYENLIYLKWKENHEKQWSVNAALFLPYPEIKKQSNVMNWFLSLFELYQKEITVVGNAMEEILLIHSTLARIDSLRGLFSSSNDEKFSSYFRDDIPLPHQSSLQDHTLNNLQEWVSMTEISPLIFSSPVLQNPIISSIAAVDQSELLSPIPHSDDSSLKSFGNTPGIDVKYGQHKDAPTVNVKNSAGNIRNKLEVETGSVATDLEAGKYQKPKVPERMSLNSYESVRTNNIFSPQQKFHKVVTEDLSDEVISVDEDRVEHSNNLRLSSVTSSSPPLAVADSNVRCLYQS
jgi:hypothetical protein